MLVCSGWVSYVPADRKTQSIVHVSGAKLRNGTRKRKPSCHFTQAHHHPENSHSCERVTEKYGEGARSCKGASDTKEETCANGTTERNELDVPRLESER